MQIRHDRAKNTAMLPPIRKFTWLGKKMEQVLQHTERLRERLKQLHKEIGQICKRIQSGDQAYWNPIIRRLLREKRVLLRIIRLYSKNGMTR